MRPCPAVHNLPGAAAWDAGHDAVEWGPPQAHAKTGGEAQEWVRAMLGTVGRGGNAQVSAWGTTGQGCCVE